MKSKTAEDGRKFTAVSAQSAVVYVGGYGTALRVEQNRILIKNDGSVTGEVPIKRCEQIVVAGRAVTLSSELIRRCAEERISIDFVDGAEHPYASMLGYKSAYAATALKQLEILQTPRRLELAAKFVKGKTKNQLNHLKYIDRYHDEAAQSIDGMARQIGKIASAKETMQLMGIEGEVATLYWQAIAKILSDKCDFKGRVTQGAKDVANAALNYGYALLYSRVQHALHRAGLALHISFLHALQEGKPTLVYDMVEEFRPFIVDRAVVSTLNRNEPLRLDGKGRLTKASAQLVVQNVTERFGSYTRHRKASKKVATIISDQAYLLARAVRGEAVYKPFIGKY